MRSEKAMQHRLKVRVLQEEHEVIFAAARKQGITASDFVRNIMTRAALEIAA